MEFAAFLVIVITRTEGQIEPLGEDRDLFEIVREVGIVR